MQSYITGDIFVRSPPKQTLKAWEPWHDCVVILFEFQNSDVDEEHPEWRLFWVAGVALLRTVGHVLAKVDASESLKHKREIDRLWSDWKTSPTENTVFWDFVEKERNSLLKTYEFGASLEHDENGCYVTYQGGEDAFELFREAVYWWRLQLETLEDRL
jgi:hypothetical protein